MARQTTPAEGTQAGTAQPALNLPDPSSWTILKVTAQAKIQHVPPKSNIHSPSIFPRSFCSACSLAFICLIRWSPFSLSTWSRSSVCSSASSDEEEQRRLYRMKKVQPLIVAGYLQTSLGASQSILHADRRLCLQAAENQQAARQPGLQRYWARVLWQLKYDSTCSQKHTPPCSSAPSDLCMPPAVYTASL